MKKRIHGLLLALVLLASLLPAAGMTVSALGETDSDDIRLPGLAFGDTAEGTTKPTEATTKPVEGTTKPTEATTKPVEGITKPSNKTTEPTKASAEATTQPSAEPVKKDTETQEEMVDAAGPDQSADGGKDTKFPWQILLAAVVVIGAGVTVAVLKRKP